MSEKPEAAPRSEQIELSAVPAPTFAETTRGMAMRAGQRIANGILRVATAANEKVQAALAAPPYQVDWLDPTDFATEQLAEHAGQFPADLSSVFFDEIAGRVQRMLAACDVIGARNREHKKGRWVSVAWRKVYYKLIIAPKQHGDPELVAVERGDTRPECASLTDDTGADLDPTAVGADVVANDPLAALLADERDDADDDREDGCPMRRDPATANSKRTAQRWRAEERSLLEMLARSAARCAELAGRVTARAAESVA